MVQSHCLGQDIRPIATDTTGQQEIILKKEAKNPRKAALLSAILPGAGQIYNEKMWKVPLIYGGIITNLYFVDFNNRRYQLFKEALMIYRDDDPTTENIFPNLNEDGLIRNVDYWRRNRDGVYLLFGAIYALNIVDALVDAHLSGFDVSDDLSLKIQPSVESLYASGNSVGLSLKLKF
ncbi:hypothetical protein GCM10028791_10660 [Echinicola sediminis]